LKTLTSIEQWARILWLSRYSEDKLIAIGFAAYFDASGKREQHPVIMVGGAVAPVYKWSRFETDWQAILHREGVNEFHATDFAASQGEYKGWRGQKERRRKFIADLYGVIKRNTNKFFCTGVEIDAWTSVNRDYMLDEYWHSPYAMCGSAVVRQALKWAKGKNVPKTNLKFIFEEGDAEWEGLKTLCNLMGVYPAPLPKQEAVPCQVGDLIAWKTRIAFSNALEKYTRFIATPYPASVKEFEELRAEENSLMTIMEVRPNTHGIMGTERLIENCEMFNVPKRAKDETKIRV
jgi:hypothetical protein